MLGTGNYGTVSKMRYTPTKQLMAMKVSDIMRKERHEGFVVVAAGVMTILEVLIFLRELHCVSSGYQTRMR